MEFLTHPVLGLNWVFLCFYLSVYFLCVQLLSVNVYSLVFLLVCFYPPVCLSLHIWCDPFCVSSFFDCLVVCFFVVVFSFVTFYFVRFLFFSFFVVSCFRFSCLLIF